MSNWNIFEWVSDQIHGTDEELTKKEFDKYDLTIEEDSEVEFSDIIQQMINEGRLGNNCRAKIQECIQAKKNFNNMKR